MFDLGPDDPTRRLPEAVTVGEQRWYLVRGDAGYQLLSAICPHQGGTVAPTATAFECPQHGWRFDLQSGCGLTSPTSRLTAIPVTVREGRLLADVAIEVPVATRGRGAHAPFPADLRIRLVAHACLEIQHSGFTLLTDPWIDGPAFLGAWIPFPASGVEASSLRPDAIWISHEHSDHFHKPTLERFPRATPIYVPAFPNGRLVKELAAMGFTDVHPVRFGQPYEIASGVRITCFEPPGLWNDSIVLFELGDIRLLNINDAGVNHRVASIVGPVDILASTYSPASSYPYVWSHLASDAKAQITERARLGMLRLLHHAVKAYQPRYLVPFASHFTLWHPSHRDFASQYRRNTLDDVKRAFARSDVEVIGMMPGGSWEPSTGSINGGDWPSDLYDLDRLRGWLHETFDQAAFDRYHPAPGPLHRDELAEYFERLNLVPEIAFTEDLTVTVEGVAGDRAIIDRSFEIRSGRLQILSGRAVEPNLVMQVPHSVLRHLVTTRASWDEAHVGFWCRFSRTPDVFHAGFWRLLQAPYFLRSAQWSTQPPSDGAITPASNVAELIERYGDQADRILSRYGLHCSGCPHAPVDSVAHAVRRHGVDPNAADRLLRELNAVAADTAPKTAIAPETVRAGA